MLMRSALVVIAPIAISTASFANSGKDTCTLEMDHKPHTRISQVIGFVTRVQALQSIGLTQAHMNGKISPDYTYQQRVRIVDSFYGDHALALALVPPGLRVGIGDKVEVSASHRDPHYPCNYVPRMIRRVVARNQ